MIVMIQARMASTRLPGKVLKEINGKPLIEYVAARAKQVRSDGVMLLTTVQREDDVLAAWAAEYGIPCYRGSEDDVLDRYVQAARQAKTTAVVRITGDCPFLDPTLVERMIEMAEGKDYVNSGATFPEGMDCEVVSVSALEEAHKHAEKQYQREHVTRYMHDHKEQFMMQTMELEKDYGSYRVTVDEPQDFEVAVQLLSLLGERYDTARMEDIISLLDEHPEIRALNSGIIRNEGLQKSLEEENEA